MVNREQCIQRISWAITGILLIQLTPAIAETSPDTVVPQVELAQPKPQAHIKGLFEIEVEATDDVGVAEVAVVRNGGFLDSTQKYPYSIPWDTSREPDGPHTLLAKAQDAAGNLAVSTPVTVIVDNTVPTVALTGVASDTMVTGKIGLVAEATDSIGLAEVQFLVDGSVKGAVKHPPYRWIWDPTVLANGPRTLEATAIDLAGNKKTSAAIHVRVANPNRPPVVLRPEPETLKEGDLFTFGMTAYDPDGVRDKLIYKSDNLPDWIELNPDNGVMTFKPGPDIASQAEPEKEIRFSLQICDPEPLCTSQEMTVKIVNVNQPPVLDPIANLTVHEGEPVRFTIKPAKDPDRDPLTYVVKRLPEWLKFDPVTQTFEGKPDYKVASLIDPVTVYRDIRVDVCDPEPLCTNQKFSITLNNTDRPPVLNSMPEQITDEGKILRFELQASDPDGDALVLSADSGLGNAVFADHGNGKGSFQWNTRLDQGGRYKLVFSAKEVNGKLKDAKQVDILIRENTLSISGTVLMSETEKPSAGTTIQVVIGSEIVQEVRTDSKGFYLISGLSPGNYIVRAKQDYIRGFSAEKPATDLGTHFSPLSHSVKLKDQDIRKVDFTRLAVD